MSGQQNYDRLVSDMGCAGAGDTLDCLRDVPYERLKQGVEDLSPGMFTYKVSVDGSWSSKLLKTDRPVVGAIVNVADHSR